MEDKCNSRVSQFAMEDKCNSGNHNSTTLRLKGTVQGRPVLILVDSGSTHNFISDQLAAEWKLQTKEVPEFGVTIGNGVVVSCNQVCPDVEIQFPGLVIKQNFYRFPLGGSELILGIKWLATLNTIQMNWKEKYLIVHINGKKYKLQGLQSNPDNSVLSLLQVLSTDHPSDPPLASLKPILQQSSLEFRLEDKSSFQGGCNDTVPTKPQKKIKSASINYVAIP